MGDGPLSLEDLALQAQNAVETLLARASALLRERLSEGGRLSAAKIEREQHAAHGLAWLATYVEALRQLAAYAQRMTETGSFGETEELLVRIGAGEYLAQITGGIPMSQGEIVRLSDLGLSASAAAARPRGSGTINNNNSAADGVRGSENERREQCRAVFKGSG